MRYNFTKSVNLGFANLYAWEFMNTFYAEGNAGWQVTDELSIGTGGHSLLGRHFIQRIDNIGSGISGFWGGGPA
jgi:hypothetical protein